MVFLSYSRSNIAQIEKLETYLKCRGTRVWRDVTSIAGGTPSETAIRRAIQSEASGMIFFLTEESLRSVPVIERELKWGLNEHQKDPNFFLLPVFVDRGPKETNELILNKVGINISGFHGVVRRDDWTEAQLCREIANEALKAVCTRTKINDEIFVGLHSRSFKKIEPTPHFDLDATGLLQDTVMIGEDNWNIIDQAFTDFYRAITSSFSSKTVRIEGKCHLSLASLLGRNFNSCSGFRMLIKQDPVFWDSACSPSDDIVLNRESLKGDLCSEEVIVELAISGDLDARDVETFIKTNKLEYRSRITVTARRGSDGERTTELRSSEEAVSVARQIRALIEGIRKEFSPKEIHLLPRMPLGLALFVGMHSNAIGPIQFYDFDKEKTRQFTPSVKLY